MVNRNRVPLSTTVSKKTFNIIQQKAIEMDTRSSVALDLIVSEWLGSNKFEQIKPPEKRLCCDLEGKLRDLEFQLDLILKVLET